MIVDSSHNMNTVAGNTDGGRAANLVADVESDLPARRPARVIASVVSHGHGALLAALLDDLMAALGPRDLLVVTLNIPEAGGFDRRRWPRAEWIDNTAPKGFGANHNHALLGRDADWVAIINPDIRMASDVLDRLVASGGGDIDIAMVAPLVVDRDGVEQDSVRALLTPSSLAGRMRGRMSDARGRAGPVSRRRDWIAGMLLLVRGDAFAVVRGFDERYFLYCEDMDFSIRLQLAGYSLRHDRGIVVVHDARRDSHHNWSHFRLHVASLLRSWASPALWRYLGGSHNRLAVAERPLQGDRDA